MTRSRKCAFADCGYATGNNGKIDDDMASIEDLRLHIMMKHRKVNDYRFKDTKVPEWVDKQFFESWKENFLLWKTVVNYDDTHYVDRVVGMLKVSSMADVTKFMVEDLLERRVENRDTSEKMVKILEDKFGENKKEALRRHVDSYRQFEMKGTTLLSLDRLENIKGYWGDILELEKPRVTVKQIKQNVEKKFQSTFVSEGLRSGKISSEQSILIAGVAGKHQEWGEFRGHLRDVVTDFE